MTVSFFYRTVRKDNDFIFYGPVFQKSQCFEPNSYFGHMFRTKIDFYSIIYRVKSARELKRANLRQKNSRQSESMKIMCGAVEVLNVAINQQIERGGKKDFGANVAVVLVVYNNIK